MNYVTGDQICYLLAVLAISAAVLIVAGRVFYGVFSYRRDRAIQIKIKLSEGDQKALDNYNNSLNKVGFSSMDLKDLSTIKSTFLDRINKAYLKAK